MGRDERNNPLSQEMHHRSTTQVYDRFARPLAAGDVVHLIGKTDIFWRVIHSKPVMDPKAPPGLVELALQAVFVTGVPGGQQVMDVIKVLDAPPQGKGADNNGDQRQEAEAAGRNGTTEHQPGQPEDSGPTGPRAID